MQKIIIIIFLVCSVVAFQNKCLAQHCKEITIVVLDSKTKKPLSGVEVYTSNDFIECKTNLKGVCKFNEKSILSDTNRNFHLYKQKYYLKRVSLNFNIKCVFFVYLVSNPNWRKDLKNVR